MSDLRRRLTLLYFTTVRDGTSAKLLRTGVSHERVLTVRTTELEWKERNN